MAETLYFVHHDVDYAQQYADDFAAKGWQVHVADPSHEYFLDNMVVDLPVAAVFFLDGDGADGVLHAAVSVLTDVRMPRPLMVFTGGTPADVEMAREAVPFAVFVQPEELTWVLKRMVFRA